MCNKDERRVDMWLSRCLALTSESWKTFRTVNTAIASAAMQAAGLRILSTWMESLKNI